MKNSIKSRNCKKVLIYNGQSYSVRLLQNYWTKFTHGFHIMILIVLKSVIYPKKRGSNVSMHPNVRAFNLVGMV